MGTLMPEWVARLRRPGSGTSGEKSTGPRGFWLWWQRHAGVVLMCYLLWLVIAAVPMFIFRDMIWPAYVYAGVSGAWWFGWLALDVAYQRRFHSEAWN